jgi:DNA-binding winged helix-turn-helix (wHTH) protein
MALAAQPNRDVLEIGPLQILPEEHLARAGGRALMLSIRELRLLTELARRADRIMAREELFLLVWGREMKAGGRSVDVYVRKLRVKLKAALAGWLFIHTHFGFGYRLAAEPHRSPTSSSQLVNTSPFAGTETLPDSNDQGDKSAYKSFWRDRGGAHRFARPGGLRFE